MAGPNPRTKPSILSARQNSAINSILKNEFSPYILESDASFSGFGAVSKWASQRKEQAFAEDASFQTEAVTANATPYKQAVDRKFRNFYYRMRDGRSPGTKRTKPPPPAQTLVDLLLPRPTAFRLFECVKKEEILEQIDEAGVDAYETCLEEMWDDLDEEEQSEYEQAAIASNTNVMQTRQLFVNNFERALNKLCQSSKLGGMAATTILAYRDAQGVAKVAVLAPTLLNFLTTDP
ncbi:unnamed protein product [Peniophora sp. CBMAI 1063]|nr:unnamed protein product [Peniophora sp. CBMAI 1063]